VLLHILEGKKRQLLLVDTIIFFFIHNMDAKEIILFKQNLYPISCMQNRERASKTLLRRF
jgi:hypothetical protein